MSGVNDLITIAAASERAHMHHRRVKEIAKAGGALVKWSTREHRIDWPLFEKIVTSQRVLPRQRTTKPAPLPTNLHPGVTC